MVAPNFKFIHYIIHLNIYFKIHFNVLTNFKINSSFVAIFNAAIFLLKRFNYGKQFQRSAT
jgi:hypothetical protein